VFKVKRCGDDTLVDILSLSTKEDCQKLADCLFGFPVYVESLVPTSFLDSLEEQEMERVRDPNWKAMWWHVDDVRCSSSNELTDYDCQSILDIAIYAHNPEYGFSWDSLRAAEEVYLRDYK